MGEKDAESVTPKSVANGKVEVEEKIEPVSEKKEEQSDGVTYIKEENKDEEKVETNDMDIDKEKVNDGKENEEKVNNKNVVKEGETDNGREEAEEKAKNEDVVNECEKDEEMEEIEERGKSEDLVKEGEKDEGVDGTKEEERQQSAEEKVSMESEELNHSPTEKTEAEDRVDDKVGGVGEKQKPRESKEERVSKSRVRTKIGAGKKDKSKSQEAEMKESNAKMEKKTKETTTSVNKKEEEPKTPATFAVDRPVRERKSVERLVAIIDQDTTKEFKVEKGRGTALKDIPNVAYKLPRKKTDDTFKLLHTVLFGRRGKAAQVKNNISRFSGFVWHDDEEKQTIKLKEKLDKIVKEKLVEFCDVLDIPIAATVKKEDIIAKLIEFLAAPHATTTELLAEKEQSSKGKKRKRVGKSASGSSTPSEGSAKSRKKTKGTSKKDSTPKPEDESEEEKDEAHDEDDVNSGSERLEDEMPAPAEREEKGSESEESDKDKRKKKQGSAKSSAKKASAKKAKTKRVTIVKEVNLPSKKASLKSPPSRQKNNEDISTKKFSGKKKDEPIKEKTSTPKKASSNASPGKKILKVRDSLKEEKLKPSDDELKNAICEILKEVDFSTATFTDVLTLLSKRFSRDLMSRKSSIKLMIQDELTKIADAEEADDEKDDGPAVKNGKKTSTGSVKA